MAIIMLIWDVLGYYAQWVVMILNIYIIIFSYIRMSSFVYKKTIQKIDKNRALVFLIILI